MSVWDLYLKKMDIRGTTKRETILKRELNMLNNKLNNSLSYHSVIINSSQYEVAITDCDNLDEKFIYTTQQGIINGGETVEWMGNYWLVIERDANSEVYTRAKLKQCNHELHWIDSDGIIHKQWCVIEDGTKYLTGEYEQGSYIVTRGDSRIAMTIGRNEDTLKFCRECRFLIDDPENDKKLAYTLSKPLKVGGLYGGYGVYKCVLQEVVSTINDNHELGIADYYKYFPNPNSSDNFSDITQDGSAETENTEQKGWL